MSTIELPLFPLNVVLFPGTVLPLHIFEPRYRQMIVDCRREDKPFGIVLVKPESEFLQEIPYEVGTMIEMREVHQLPDGRYVLMALGIKRFRIISQHREKPYLSGIVELLDDVAEPAEQLASFAQQVQFLFEDYLDLVLKASGEEKTIEVPLPDDPEELSHFIAYFLDLQEDLKQHLLELTSTQQRLQEEITILRREVPFLRQLLSKKLTHERTMLN
jgi:Lon protease-like protein